MNGLQITLQNFDYQEYRKGVIVPMGAKVSRRVDDRPCFPRHLDESGWK